MTRMIVISTSVRRLHLRHPAHRRRQGHGADLLREPHLPPSRPRSVGLRPTRCVVHLLRYPPPAGSLWLAISGFASGSVAQLGSFGSKLALNAAELPKLDAEFEEITEGEELTKKESRAAWDAARQTERSAGCRSRGATTASTERPSGPRWRRWWGSETHRAGGR